MKYLVVNRDTLDVVARVKRRHEALRMSRAPELVPVPESRGPQDCPECGVRFMPVAGDPVACKACNAAAMDPRQIRKGKKALRKPVPPPKPAIIATPCRSCGSPCRDGASYCDDACRAAAGAWRYRRDGDKAGWRVTSGWPSVDPPMDATIRVAKDLTEDIRVLVDREDGKGRTIVLFRGGVVASSGFGDSAWRCGLAAVLASSSEHARDEDDQHDEDVQLPPHHPRYWRHASETPDDEAPKPAHRPYPADVTNRKTWRPTGAPERTDAADLWRVVRDSGAFRAVSCGHRTPPRSAAA